jgi:NAD(P)-dependent dehydrogenase (short-subunit alcohol dehydrogenase family)
MGSKVKPKSCSNKVMSLDRRQFLRLTGAAAAAPMIGGCSSHKRIPTDGVPRGDYDEDSTAEEVTAGIDLTGRTAVVTGCNSGIGYETMRVLALRGARVIGTGRTFAKASDACSSVAGITMPVELELSDFESIVACAETVRSYGTPIDMLICNAGMLGGDLEHVYGLEKHFVVNHLGHFIFVNNLLDRLDLSSQGRVVVVGSRAAYTNAPQEGIEFGNLRGTANYRKIRAYGHSKLANVLFSLELARRLDGTRITSNSLHPGVINTNIDRQYPRFFQGAFRVLTAVGGKSVEQGAATSCYVATSPLLSGVSGQFFENCNAVTVVGDNHMHDTAQAAELWNVSEALTSDYLPKLKLRPRNDLGQRT